MELDLTHEVVGRYDVLIPRGDLDIATHSVLHFRIVELLGAGRHHLVVDLGETTFIDSMALGTLIKATKSATVVGGTFAIICDDPRIVRMFTVTRLADFLTRFDTREMWAAATGPHDADAD